MIRNWLIKVLKLRISPAPLPKYCKKCGKQIVVTNIPLGYDEQTGTLLTKDSIYACPEIKDGNVLEKQLEGHTYRKV